YTRPLYLFLAYASPPLRDLHPFPTRRSSDLDRSADGLPPARQSPQGRWPVAPGKVTDEACTRMGAAGAVGRLCRRALLPGAADRDRKSTRLNSSHVKISYAVFCLKKKKNHIN